jgi:hypothetical protein
MLKGYKRMLKSGMDAKRLQKDAKKLPQKSDYWWRVKST